MKLSFKVNPATEEEIALIEESQREANGKYIHLFATEDGGRKPANNAEREESKIVH